MQPVDASLRLTDLPEEMLREVAAAGGFRALALMAATCRPLRDAVRTMTWPRGVPCALPTDRPTYLAGQVTVVGGEIVGVPDDKYTGGKVGHRSGNWYLFVRGPGTVVRMVDTTLRGVGLHISDGATVELVNVSIDKPPGSGVGAEGLGSSFAFDGGEIVGAGVSIYSSGKGSLRGVTVSGSSAFGIWCAQLGQCDAQDVKIHASSDTGVWVSGGASVTLKSVEASENGGGSLECAHGSEIVIEDGCDLEGVTPGMDLSVFCSNGGEIVCGDTVFTGEYNYDETSVDSDEHLEKLISLAERAAERLSEWEKISSRSSSEA